MKRNTISKAVKDFVKLGDEIKAYGNGMFLTVNYPVRVYEGYDVMGAFMRREREEYRFKLVLRDTQYKRINHWFLDDERFHSEAIIKEFTMAQVTECRKYWLKVRNKPLPSPEWIQW